MCGFDLVSRYGELGDGYIHVHHLKELSSLRRSYQVDPIKDLRPVCPNCHDAPPANPGAAGASRPTSGRCAIGFGAGEWVKVLCTTSSACTTARPAELMAGSESFAPGVTEKLGFYVYLLIDPRDGEVFYVGKGTGDRCFQHLKQAHHTKANATAEFGRLDRIRGIEAAGYETRIEVLRHGLDAETAYAVEAAAIDLLNLADLTNLVTGTHSAEVGRMSATDLDQPLRGQVMAITHPTVSSSFASTRSSTTP